MFSLGHNEFSFEYIKPSVVKFSVVFKMQETDPWKMCKSKEGEKRKVKRDFVCGRC